MEWKKSFVQMEGLYQRIQDQLDGRLAALCEFIIAKEGIKVRKPLSSRLGHSMSTLLCIFVGVVNLVVSPDDR